MLKRSRVAAQAVIRSYRMMNLGNVSSRCTQRAPHGQRQVYTIYLQIDELDIITHEAVFCNLYEHESGHFPTTGSHTNAAKQRRVLHYGLQAMKILPRKPPKDASHCFVPAHTSPAGY